ncbi:hypothetical protein IFM89_018600 [Coptis chinensis]|uniref:RNase H type-1 domain-containing protein n=1 Tax=Coptis chinensis TaxID=261450 RepID=A0A835LVJ7_9MAGN|nr:hypothetical protein IFM89_018600 [Coptis chinensis]
MQGIEAGLQAAKSLTQHLIVNSDSARAINIINGIESTPWNCQYLLPTIKGHCGSFRSIVFQHIYREDIIKSNKPDIIGLAEPLILPPNSTPLVFTGLGYNTMFLHNNTVDRIGNIWVMWKDGLAVNLVNLSHQQITVQINQTLITFVHASSYYGRLNLMLWDELNRINVGNLARLLRRFQCGYLHYPKERGGDFLAEVLCE